MTNVILVGANGRTARETIPRLLEQEDVRLTLFSRRASRLQALENSRVAIPEGDAENVGDLRDAIEGQDIVVSTMGGMDLDVKTENVVRAMEEVGVRRLIAISARGSLWRTARAVQLMG